LTLSAASGPMTSRPGGTKGSASKLMESRILRIAKKYRRLTVRQLYYIMISRFEYPPGRRFYKRFVYHLSKIRRTDLQLDAKIVDRTREFIPASPFAFHQIELWVEKDAIRMQAEHLAAKYKISIQVLRGFGSLSMYRKALKRAAKSHVRKILYVGDFDPSGVHIEQVAAREMGIEIRRVAITPEQARRYRLPPISVNRRDSRVERFIQRYGNKAWELEALRPRTFLKILEEELKVNVPERFLLKAAAKEKAARIAKPVARRLVRKMEQEVLRMLKKGRSEREIMKVMASRFGLRKNRKKD
jgi:hypothetical protein